MPTEQRQLRDALKLAIKGLILQEVRAVQLEQVRSPSFILDEIVRSIQETMRKIIGLVRFMPAKERDVLIKRLILQSVDEEIEQTIQVRKNRCFRCAHIRFYDEGKTAHVRLPIGTRRAEMIGCDKPRPADGVRCRRFVEATRAISLDDYLDEMALLYKLRETITRMREVWEYLKA